MAALADGNRLLAGQRLLALRKRVSNLGRSGWVSWGERHIGRSRSEIGRLMRLARSADPKATLEEQREDNRRQKAEQRERDKSLRNNGPDVRAAKTQQLLAVAQEEKTAAAAAAQRRQEVMAEKFRVDQEARAVQRVRAEHTAAVAALPVDAAAIEINLDHSGCLLWKRVPFVVEKIGSVLSVAEMHALHALVVGTVRHRRAFADAISNWISSSAACADGPTVTDEPADDPDDFEDQSPAGIERRNAARAAAQDARA